MLQFCVDNYPLITSSEDLGLDVVDGVGSLDIKGLAGQGLHKDPHTTTKAQQEVEGGLLLDVVVRKGAAIFQLLAVLALTLSMVSEASTSRVKICIPRKTKWTEGSFWML